MERAAPRRGRTAYDDLRHSGRARRTIDEGRISEEALQAITGVRRDRLASFLNGTTSGTAGRLSTAQPVLSDDEAHRVSALAAQLTAGLEIGSDERVRGILESLTAQFHLTYRNIALLTLIDHDDLESFVRDPESVPPETKYELGVRVSYLVNAVARAHGR